MTLTLLFAALSGLASTLLFALCPTLDWWWRIPLWLGFYLAIGLVYLLGVVFAFRLLPLKEPSPRRQRVSHRIVELTLSWLLVQLGYRITATDTGKLPDVPFLLVGNHRSAFDPLCTEAALSGKNMVFVAKPSVFKIPVIGEVLRRLCFMPIDRENARNAVATIKRSAQLIREVGLSVGIYPEGTRSKTGEMLPFHAGSFKIAKLADCPVVVTSIRYEKRKWLPWGKRVHLHVVDVMDPSTVGQNGTNELAEMAQKAICAHLEKQ